MSWAAKGEEQQQQSGSGAALVWSGLDPSLHPRGTYHDVEVCDFQIGGLVVEGMRRRWEVGEDGRGLFSCRENFGGVGRCVWRRIWCRGERRWALEAGGRDEDTPKG